MVLSLHSRPLACSILQIFKFPAVAFGWLLNRRQVSQTNTHYSPNRQRDRQTDIETDRQSQLLLDRQRHFLLLKCVLTTYLSTASVSRNHSKACAPQQKSRYILQKRSSVFPQLDNFSPLTRIFAVHVIVTHQNRIEET